MALGGEKPLEEVIKMKGNAELVKVLLKIIIKNFKIMLILQQEKKRTFKTFIVFTYRSIQLFFKRLKN